MRLRTIASVLFAAMLPVTAAAQETPADWTEFTPPANAGFVLSLKHPPEWTPSFFALRDQPRFDDPALRRKWHAQQLVLQLSAPDHRNIRIAMSTYADPRPLADFLGSHSYAREIRETTVSADFDGSFDQPYWVRIESDDKETRRPTYKQIYSMYRERVLIEASVGTFDAEKFSDLESTFDAIMRSLSVTPAEDHDPATLPRIYASPQVVMTPGNWWLEGSFSAVVPAGWTVERVEAVTGQGDHRTGRPGRIEIEFFPPGPPEDASITVRLDGYGYGTRLSAEQFLGTRDDVLAYAVETPQEVPDDANAEIPEGRVRPSRIMQDGFCLSQARTRRFDASRRIETGSFLGADPLTGEEVKLRTYTAGGVTLACNLVIRATPERFDAFLPEAKEFIRSVQVLAEGLIMLK